MEGKGSVAAAGLCCSVKPASSVEAAHSLKDLFTRKWSPDYSNTSKEPTTCTIDVLVGAQQLTVTALLLVLLQHNHKPFSI